MNENTFFTILKKIINTYSPSNNTIHLYYILFNGERIIMPNHKSIWGTIGAAKNAFHNAYKSYLVQYIQYSLAGINIEEVEYNDKIQCEIDKYYINALHMYDEQFQNLINSNALQIIQLK